MSHNDFCNAQNCLPNPNTKNYIGAILKWLCPIMKSLYKCRYRFPIQSIDARGMPLVCACINSSFGSSPMKCKFLAYLANAPSLSVMQTRVPYFSHFARSPQRSDVNRLYNRLIPVFIERVSIIILQLSVRCMHIVHNR